MTTLNLLLLVLVVFLLGIHVARGSVILPDQVQELVLTEHPPEWSRGQVAFRPDPESVGKLFAAGSVRLRQFPLPGGRWVDLELMSTQLIHSGTRFLVSDAQGIRETTAPAMQFFRGQVSGEAESLVSLSVIDGQVAGFVRTGGREFSFRQTAAPGQGRASAMVRVRDDAEETEAGGTCDGENEHVRSDALAGPVPDFSSVESGSPAPSIDGDTLLLGQIAVEGTVEWVNKHGGVAGAQAYTLNLMSQVSAIYENDLKVQLQVPWVLMHTAEPDGYSGDANSTSTVLNEMVSNWNSNDTLRNVFRTTAHLFSTYPSGGAGRAYVNVLCDGVPANSNSRDFGVSLISGNGGSWERGLVAHELGHNFSSPHTHCFSPEIDQCYGGQSGCYSGPDVPTSGTIMSYCGSSVDTFHQRVRQEKMRPAAEAAFPSCMAVAGMPGSLASASLTLEPAAICQPDTLQNDPGNSSSSLGYSGSAQAAWVKRLTPSCYPFQLTDIQVRISNSSSVAVGRPVRLLVYSDPGGSGNPASATLIHSEDAAVQSAGGSSWNQFALSSPVTVTGGDLYLGLFDLEADAGNTYIMDFNSSSSGDSWLQANGTSAGGYGAFSSGTWMIRGQGGGAPAGSVSMSWGLPCNAAAVPDQDFAIYTGPLGDWSNLTSLTCSTGRDTSWFIDGIEPNMFWLVVPQNSANEGSYGRSSFGERAPAALPCKPQAIATCP